MKSKYKNNKVKEILIKILQLIVILIMIGLIFIISKGIYSRIQDEKTINNGIEILRSEMNKYDYENNNLNKLVKYFESVEFQEKEIKDKLNLVKDGEKIVFVQGGVSKQGNDNFYNKKNDVIITTTHANYYYWWEYFFKR